MRSLIRIYVFSSLVILLMGGCSSVRKVEKTPPSVRLSAETYARKLIESESAWDAISGKATLFLEVGGERSKKIAANVRIERGNMIRFSVAPLLGIEAMRLEISSDGVLLLDRLHKQYARVSFDEIGRLLQIDLDFQTFQSLFLNELFLPGKTNLQASDLNKFRITENGRDIWLETDAARYMDFGFLISGDSGLLEKCCIGVRKTSCFLNWDYAAFEELDGKLFPRHMVLLTEGSGKMLRLDLSYSRLSAAEAVGERTAVPSRYAEIELRDLLKKLDE